MSSILETAFSESEIKNEFAQYSYTAKNLKLQKGVEKQLTKIAEQVTQIRNNKGFADGDVVSRTEYNLEDAVKDQLGVKNIGDFYHAIGFNPKTMSLSAFAQKFAGMSNLDQNTLGEILVASRNFSGTGGGNAIAGIAPASAWLISELVRRPIVVSYNRNANYPSWSAATVAVTKQKGEFPIINTNDLLAQEKNTGKADKKENTQTRRSVLELSTKPYEVKTRQVTMEITDELLRDFEFDLMSISMREATRNLAAQGDALFINRMFYGDVNNSGVYPEQPAHLGVATINTLVRADILRTMRLAKQIGYMPNRAILSDKASINNLGGTAEYRTFDEIFTGVGVSDIPLAAGYSVYWDQTMAMASLNYQPMQVETQRDAETGKTMLVMRHFVGFTVLAKNAIWWQNEGTTSDARVPANAGVYGDITGSYL
jgi:hypothetical protein